MAKATFERVFTIKGAEVYVAREAPVEVEEAVPEEAALPPEVRNEVTTATKKVDSGLDRIESVLRELINEIKNNKSVDLSIQNLCREILKLTQDTVHLKESVNAIPDSMKGLLSGVTAAIKELSDNVLKTGKGTPETGSELNKLHEFLERFDKSVQSIKDIPAAAVREVRKVVEGHSENMRSLFKEASEAMAKEQKEVGKVAEAAVESVHDTKNATEVLNALLKEFDKGFPNLTDMLLRLCSYFEQVRAQNLPWQEKLAMERAGVELKKIMDFVVNIEDKTAADSDRITESYAKLSDDFERLRSEVRGSYKEQLEAAYQQLSELKSSFENLTGSFEVNISSLKDTLIDAHNELSGEKATARNISDLVGDIIKKLKLALALALKLHNNLMPPLLELMADSEDFFSASGRLIANIEESLVKATEIVFTPVVSPAREFEPPPSKEYVSLKARVEANLDKLKYMTKMHYFMLDVEAMTETKKAFSTILRFYEMFSRAVEGGSRRIHSINRCRAYEKKLIPYIEHFNKMLIRFSGAPRQRGGSDYDDYRYYLTKMETTTKNINYHYVSLQT